MFAARGLGNVVNGFNTVQSQPQVQIQSQGQLRTQNQGQVQTVTTPVINQVQQTISQPQVQS